MRLLAYVAAFTALLAAPAAALTAPTEPEFTAAAFRHHVAFLADDRLEGRGTGQRGHEIAALYVAQQFAGMGLEPAGDGGSWYQSIRFQERALGERASLTITGPDGVHVFAHADRVLLGPSALERSTVFEAPVVFVGFGLDDPKNGFDDYKDLDVRGKVVVFLSGTPKGTSSEIGAHLGSNKARMAMERGAIGTLQISTTLGEKTFPFARRLPGARTPRLAWVGADGAPYLEAPGIRAAATLDTAAAERLFAGARRTLADVRIEADREGGAPKGFALQSKVRFDFTSTHRTLESPNVAALLPGSDPELKDEVVLIMGHLDHLGVRPDWPGEDKIFNGAMDNATGISAMLEAARAFTTAGHRPRRSILFLAVTAEEKGLLGAQYFAHNPTIPLERIAGVVNIDMPTLTYDFADVVAFGGESTTLGQIAERAAARVGVKLSPDPAPEQGTFTRSDHYELVRMGVPSIYLDTGPHDASGGRSGATASEHFVEHHYHEPSDDLEQPIDWEAGAKFAKVNWLIAREIANGDERPRWYEGDFFGDLFAAGQPRVKKGLGQG